MKRVLVSGLTVLLLVGLAALPVAAVGVQRNQVTTNVYELQIGNWHDWTIVFGCDELSATGSQRGGPHETITVSQSGGTIHFSAVYQGGWGGQPYSWEGSFPIAGGVGTATDSGGGEYAFLVRLVSSTTTTYANHGEYVAESGGGAGAAQSCVGKPVSSNR